MQRVRIQGGATAGVALVAAALSLAACSSSGSGGSSSSTSPSASSSSAAAKLSGTLNGSGSTFQTTFQQTAIQSFKSIQPGLTVNYGGGGSGKGRTDLASGVVNYAGSDSPIPASQASIFTGKTVLYFPVVIGPITVSYNLSGVSNLKLDGPVIAQHLRRLRSPRGTTPRSRRSTPVSRCPAPPITIARRSDSSGTTQNFSEFLVKAAPGRVDARQQLDHQLARLQPRRQRQRRRGVDHQEHRRGHRLRGLRRRQGVRAGLRVGQEPGRRLRRAVDVVGLRRRQPGHRRARPDVQRDLGARRELVPDHLPVVGSGLRGSVQLDDGGEPQGVHRLPARRRPEAAPRAELRAAALQHRPDGDGAAQQDRLVVGDPGTELVAEHGNAGAPDRFATT